MTDSRAYVLLTSTAAIWGFSWICGRVMSSQGIPPSHASLARFILGSVGLLVIMLGHRPWPSLTPRLLLRLFCMGFVGVFLYNLCFFTGLRTVPAGRASLMASLQPSVVFLFAALFWGERVSVLKIIGIVVSFIGALLVLSQGEPSRLFQQGVNTGDLWVLGCVLSWVAYTLIGRTLMGRLPAVVTTAYSTWLGTIPLILLVWYQGIPMQAWSPTAWLSAFFLGLAGTTAAFLMFVKGLGQIGAPRTSIFINFVPVFGVLFSALVLGEKLGASMLIGGLLVIAGVRILNR